MEMMISYKNGRKNTYIKEGKYMFISNIKISPKNSSKTSKEKDDDDFNIYDDINLMVNMINKKKNMKNLY
ncbi:MULTISPECIES: hypothetical protein [Clostridium]|uniref:Uncharacterized protein n=2 Tax=Clostridium TaxID=1485 RepID=A0AA86JIY4_9CLOT|nr:MULTISPECIES: hypothetical protein [Clostridium]MBP8315165.1 hypothetical protein [Clostridium neonatale]MBS4782871.1 hypothetical protein [Clostridium sp.]MDU4479336.1 hypothetical protein [Clostridium sp.]CAG9707150.1 Conserved hypothetical protein [Clostridium neonatale]CAG9711946.1 Conserved hypothetical protein [Clostridium neonatale]